MTSRFDDDQLKALSNIMADIGQVIFGLTVVPILVDFDNAKPIVLLSGLFITFGCWILSIIFARKRK